MRIVTGAGIVLLAVLAGVYGWRRDVAAQGTAAQAPYFEVDPLWPKPLPNHWLIGSAIGVTVDSRGHVWMVHRPDTLVDNEIGLETTPPRGVCCAAAPPVLEFDATGNLVGHWGGPGKGYEWPASNHGIFADAKGNIWIGGNGQEDAQVLKFTREGKFLLQIGRSGARRGDETHEGVNWNGNSSDPNAFGRVAKIFVDPRDNEAYLADGYLNRRVAVVDADSGRMKRFWGAYGNKPEDGPNGSYDPKAAAAQQYRNPVHCADMSVDRLVYVCDRQGNRLQVFQTNGTFVKEKSLGKETLGSGAVWDIAFSRDPQQAYLYVADGTNMRIRVLRRDSLEELTSFGDGGRQPGQFFGVHSIATDPQGNIYTTETYEGKRLQKFVYRGLRAVARKDQGTVWGR